MCIRDSIPPPLIDDPLGRLVGRVEDEMRDREVSEREHEQGEPRKAHQIPDAQLEPTAMRARPAGQCMDRHHDAPAQMGRRMMYAPGRPTTMNTTQLAYQSCLW